jgi:uncharacterized caspase-like protein/tetratricopeptide (TPR) repeat protein
VTPGNDRAVRDAANEEPPLIAPVGDRWAVIVGISRYQDSDLDLKYACRDAEEVHALVCTPEGGNFPAGRTRLLVDDGATTRALTQALRGFLMAAMSQDLVLLYFACHGGPDPRRPAGPLYLYTHDTDPADVAGTGLPMDDIDRSLRQVVRAERAVIVVDTCHSGGVGGGIRAAGRAEATNRYLEALARARGGVAVLTSAEASEASEEDSRWGGGHGVFTHYLLEGMRGAADGYRGTRDGIVSLGELFEYVRDQVQNATGGRQHPAIGTTAFDRGLPMAVTAELDVEQHLSLGRGLYEIGWRLDEPAPFLLAARQFALASDLKRHLPSADVSRGCALLAAGRAAEAAQVLEVATTMAREEVDADAWLCLGIGRAERGQAGPAAQAFREYVRRAPAEPEAGWAAAYAGWVEGTERPRRRHALLLGVGAFADGSSVPPLAGPSNDVKLMSDTLVGALNIAAGDIRILADSAATREAVLEALAAYANADPDDVVIVYFAGHSVSTAALDEPYLITFEGGNPDGGVIGITVRELVDALNLPVREVVLVLDTHVSASLVQRAQQVPSGRLTILLACGVEELAGEGAMSGQVHGAFTYFLTQALMRGETASYGDLIDAVRAEGSRLEMRYQQTAQLIGSRSAPAFAGRFPAADLWRISRRRTARPDQIEGLRRRCEEISAPLATWALGRALLEHGDVHGGEQELKRARDALHEAPPDLWIDLATAALARSDPAAARDVLRAAVAASGGNEPVAAALTALAALALTPTVLVVAADPSGIALGAADVAPQIITLLLTTIPGIAAADIVSLTQRATRTQILDEITGLARRADDRFALLVMLGAMSSLGDQQVLLVHDGVVPVADIWTALDGAENLLTVLDVLPTLALGAAGRDVTFQEDARKSAISLPGIATVTLFEDDFDRPVLTAGELTGRPLLALLRTLHTAIGADRTYREWAESTRLPGLARVEVQGWVDERVMQDRSSMIAARRHLAAARTADAAETARCAEAEIARRDAKHEPHPEGYLQRGLALEVCQRHADALASLRTARNLYEDESVWQAEQRRDPAASEWLRQAHYHYGRLQLEYGGDLNEAVAALRAALQQDGDDPRVLRTLAQAIRALVERETLMEAAGLLTRYVNSGAPLGMTQEMAGFLNRRRPR